MNNPINAQFLQQYAQGKSYGPEFKFVYDAFRNQGVSSLVGPDVLFNYQAQLYNGDTLLPLNQPLITDIGLASGEGYTNALPEGAEDLSTWTLDGASVDGDLVTENSGSTTYHRVYNSMPEDTPYSLSVIAKYNGRNIQIATNFADVYVNFDLQNGVVGASNQMSGTIEDVGDGWFLCSALIETLSPVRSCVSLINDINAGRNPEYIGDGISGAYVKEPQAVNSAYHHDYIPPGKSQASMVGAVDNGMRVPIEEYVDGVPKPKQQVLRNLFRGTPDGVEIAPSVVRGANGAIVTKIDNNTYSVDSVGTTSGLRLEGISTEVGSVYRLYRSVAGDCASNELYAWDEGYTNARTLEWKYDNVYELKATSTTTILTVATIPEDGVTCTIGFSIQKLTPQPMTLCTTVKMGVGSDELLTRTVATSGNIVTIVEGDLYNLSSIRVVPELSYAGIVRAYDGNAFNTVTNGWSTNDVISRITQVSTDGTQFRVGYLNHTEGETSFTVSSWATYDGSFDPEELMIMFFGNEHPNHLQQIYAIEGQYDLDKLAKEVLKNARV